MKKNNLIIVLLLIAGLSVRAQMQKATINGYIKDLYMYYKPDMSLPGINADHLSMNLIHNRINFRWYATDRLTIAVEARNRLFSGQLIRKFPQYEEMVNTSPGYFDLAATVASGNGWFLHAMIDRAWVDYYLGNWQFTAGRQRINWGLNLVWNPNDIFNTYSYFDFDYEERPGADALKVQYYTGATSSAELVYKIDRNILDEAESTIAAKYRFTRVGYDFQFLGGRTPRDFVLGGGWTGDVEGAGFRGEASWFIPHKNNTGSNGSLVASASGDYTLKNSLYIHAAALYNSQGVTGNAGSRNFFDQEISAKNLSPARYNLFGQLSFPFTPLFSGSLSGIINPSDGSSYIGPSMTWSLLTNLELLVTGQLFFGKSGTEYGELGKAIYIRLKGSF